MAGFDLGDPERSGPELTGGAVLPTGSSGALSFLSPPRGPGELGWFGEYRVVGVLGAGGMGVVFEAEEVALGRPVALKVLRSELVADSAGRERFLREARAAAALSSDYAVTIYHVGEVTGVPYLAMERLHGETLQSRIARTPRLDPTTALTIARQAALGLSAAHQIGLIHRDIKPANLFLESDGPGGPFKRVRLLDFGIARRVKGEVSLTATGFILGTPNYMAPEQAAGAEVDGRADLFSLGAVLYTILAGEMPFPGDSAMAVLMALASRIPPAVAQLNPSVPVLVSDLISRMMTKEPDGRPRSAREVVAALDTELAKLPTWVLTPPLGTALMLPVETVGPTEVLTSPGTSLERLSPRGPSRRAVLRAAGGAAVLGGLGAAGWFAYQRFMPAGPPIKVGVLHSQTGTMKVSEGPVIDATLLAIEELNRGRGVLRRVLSPVLVDGKSDPAVFAAEAERLIREDKVAVIFGCWTSASRKAVRPVVERHNGLLFYPIQYEGLEESPRVVYLGPTPNQQLLPALNYLADDLGKQRLFLVGSDYVFPRAANAIARDWLKKKPRVTVVGEEYYPLGSPHVAAVVDRIKAAKPDAILNTINGSTNFAFFRELRKEGFHPDQVPTLSLSISENEIRGLDPTVLAGDLLAASYFQSVDRDENREFIRKVRDRFGPERTTSDGMAAAYTGVRLWGQAVVAAKTPDPAAVADAIRGQEYAAPGGVVWIDPDTRHTWLPWRVGRIEANGLVTIVAGTDQSIRPEPFPPSRKPAEWGRFLSEWNEKWDGRWQPANP